MIISGERNLAVFACCILLTCKNCVKYRKFIRKNCVLALRDWISCGIILLEVKEMTLRELRKQNNMTQVECAEFLGIPVRTYQNYETDLSKEGTMKYLYMMEKLAKYGYVDETHGVLSLQQIKDRCGEVFSEFDVEYCYLFGSYARGEAKEDSDVDLLISTNMSGMQFFELVETIRESLRKKVDVLNFGQLADNPELVNEILRDGVKIYGKQER